MERGRGRERAVKGGDEEEESSGKQIPQCKQMPVFKFILFHLDNVTAGTYE